MKVIVLGGGVTGCAVTRELTERKHEVTLIEKNSYLGGGCHTFFWGGHPYTEGPRPLYVANDKVFSYINDIVPLRKLQVITESYIERDKRFYSFPPHYDDVQLMPDSEKIMEELSQLPKINEETNLEDGWKKGIGETLYDKFIKTYTNKMWKITDNTIFSDFNWSKRGPFIKSGSRATEFQKGNAWHAYPIEETGYNRFFEYCVRDAKVILGTEVKNIDLEKKMVYINDNVIKADTIISTISLDELMNYAYGELKYIGRDFIPIVLPVERILKENHHSLQYPNQEEYVRIVEYKDLTQHKSKDTLLVMEIPSHNNKLYPYCGVKSEYNKAKQYLDNLPANVFALGRTGTYQYLDICQCLQMVWDFISDIYK